jgi:hypothetical protein
MAGSLSAATVAAAPPGAPRSSVSTLGSCCSDSGVPS